MTPESDYRTCICGKPDCDIPFGYCHCGCGRKTGIAPYSSAVCKMVGGLPRRFIQSHGARTRTFSEKAQPFKLDGIYCRLIPLGRGFYTIVDAADYEWLNQWKWCSHWNATTKSYIPTRTQYLRIVNGKRKDRTVIMSREILGLKFGERVHAEHANRNTLDNRRSNLRRSTHGENMCNRPTFASNKSGFKGVHQHKRSKRWTAMIQYNKVRYCLGNSFLTPEAAYAAYCDAAAMLHGNFACTEAKRGKTNYQST